MSDYEPKLVHLPGSRLTPEVVLHRTLNKLERIKGVVVIVQWGDDTFDVDWSQMKTSELAMAGVVLNGMAADIIFKRAPKD